MVGGGRERGSGCLGSGFGGERGKAYLGQGSPKAIPPGINGLVTELNS